MRSRLASSAAQRSIARPEKLLHGARFGIAAYCMPGLTCLQTDNRCKHADRPKLDTVDRQ